MNNHEESSKSHLGEIRQAISKISCLRARAIYLRKISQENHVKRMQKARSRCEPLSPVFILHTNSPHGDPKCSQNDLPTLLKSPNKTVIKEDIQVKDKNSHKFKKINQNNESVKTCVSDDPKTVTKIDDDKTAASINGPKDKQKTIVKSSLSKGKLSKQEKSERKESEKKPFINKVSKEKTTKKNSKKISIFYSESPLVPTDLDKDQGDTCAIMNDDVPNSPKQMSPNFGKIHEKSPAITPEKAIKTKNGSINQNQIKSPEKAESVHELSNSTNKLNVDETKLKGDPKSKTVHAPETSHSSKRTAKKKSKGLSRHKTSTLKSSQNKEKKIKESKNKVHVTNVNKTSRSRKVHPNTILKTIVKRDPSILSHSMSLDSLEDLRKTLKEKVSPAPRTIDKVRNFINDKSDLMTSTSLESYHQTDKKVNNSDKKNSKPYGSASSSKIPIHEFRAYQTRKQGKDNEILEESPQYKFRVKDKEVFDDEYSESTSDISPPFNPFKNKKSIVKSWLKSVPEVTQKFEKTGKKARECVPSSISFITENSICETGNQTYLKNGANDFSEIGKEASPSPKSLRCTTRNKTTEVEDPNSNAQSSAVSISSPRANALNEFEEEARKRFAAIKNNLGSIIRNSDHKFVKDSKEFLINPIEKFMNEINLAMNHSDSEEGFNESSRESVSKPARKMKSEKQPVKWKR